MFCTGRSAVWLSASAWGAGGRRFESSRPDQNHDIIEITEALTEISGGLFCCMYDIILSPCFPGNTHKREAKDHGEEV